MNFRLVISFYNQKTDKWQKLNSEKRYPNLEEAKIQAYKVITSGNLKSYIILKYGDVIY